MLVYSTQGPRRREHAVHAHVGTSRLCAARPPASRRSSSPRPTLRSTRERPSTSRTDGRGPPPLLPGRTPEDGRRGAGPRGPGAPPHHGRLARHDCPGREGAPLRPIPQPAARQALLRRLVQLGPPGAAIPARALPALRLPAQPVQPARPGVAQLPLPRTIRRTDHDARAALHGALCEHRPGQVRRHHRRGRPPRLEHRPGRGAGHLPSRVRQRKELRGAPRIPRDAPRVGGDDQGRAAPAPARASCEPARQAVCIA
mmetsp:Transcript_17363/g.56803  ORF Transcript_17363/g.56803 Transcript_17363/m.56803 type:complete len:257 (-) Transcript_17363:230-1000(-)